MNRTPQSGRTLTLTPTREDLRIAWLTALAIAIHVAESALPSPLPGAKPGLANVVTLAVLFLYGWRAAVWVSLLRVLVGSLLLGTFLTPAFALSLSGALASLAVLGAALALSRGLARLSPGLHLGPVGMALLAALAHMGGQFLCAYAFFIPHQGLFTLLPPLMTLAAFFGFASGLVVAAMLPHLESQPPRAAAAPEVQDGEGLRP